MTQGEAFARVKEALEHAGEPRLVLILSRQEDGATAAEILGTADLTDRELATAAAALLSPEIQGRTLNASQAWRN